MKKGKRIGLIAAAGVLAAVLAVWLAFMSRAVSLDDLLGGGAYHVLAVYSDAQLYTDGFTEEGDVLDLLAEYRMRRVWTLDRTYTISGGGTLYRVYLGNEDGTGVNVQVFLCAGAKTRFELNPGAEGSVQVYEAVSGEEHTQELLEILQDMGT